MNPSLHHYHFKLHSRCIEVTGYFYKWLPTLGVHHEFITREKCKIRTSTAHWVDCWCNSSKSVDFNKTFTQYIDCWHFSKKEVHKNKSLCMSIRNLKLNEYLFTTDTTRFHMLINDSQVALASYSCKIHQFIFKIGPKNRRSNIMEYIWTQNSVKLVAKCKS